MLELRPFSIYAFTIIFNLLNVSAGYAASSNNFSSSSLLTSEKIISKDETSRNSAAFTKDRLKIVSQENSIEPTEQKDNTLSLLGIGATLIVFLLVLISLFKEEKSSELEPNKDAIQDNNLAKSDNLKLPSNLTQTNADRAKTTQIEVAKSAGDLQFIDPLPKMDDACEPIVDSDIMGKLTIVADSTTEIDVVFELIRDLEYESNPNDSVRQKDLRRKAIWELAQTNDCRAIEPLIKTIPKVDSLEKNLILDTITRIASHSLESINSVLLTSLEDERVEVRKNAIQDLTVLYQSMSSISVHLSQMTQDSDREVRQTAEWALKQLEQKSTLESVESIEIRK